MIQNEKKRGRFERRRVLVNGEVYGGVDCGRLTVGCDGPSGVEVELIEMI